LVVTTGVSGSVEPPGFEVSWEEKDESSPCESGYGDTGALGGDDDSAAAFALADTSPTRFVSRLGDDASPPTTGPGVVGASMSTETSVMETSRAVRKDVSRSSIESSTKSALTSCSFATEAARSSSSAPFQNESGDIPMDGDSALRDSADKSEPPRNAIASAFVNETGVSVPGAHRVVALSAAFSAF
jgi:hypothetical protein|tara:strand:- start:622 stop:1182 length:561 start_codon:yes stop_codon:yes gene_type:complete